MIPNVSTTNDWLNYIVFIDSWLLSDSDSKKCDSEILELRQIHEEEDRV
jgi:hypothetical protein